MIDWVTHARVHLATGDRDALAAAGQAAPVGPIRDLIARMVRDGGVPPSEWHDIDASVDHAPLEARATVRLLVMCPVADVFEYLHRLPLHRKKELSGLAMRACLSSIEISRGIGFPEVTATFLVVLGGGLAREHRWAAAHKRFEEALGICRELAKADRATYLPRVALILNNLGAVLRTQRYFREARDALEEALKLRRELAAAEPGKFLSDVATTLHNLGLVMTAQMDFAAGRAACEEGLGIRRQLATKNPDTHLPQVATALNGLGVVLSKQREFAAARAAHEEALSIQRELAKTEPHMYLPRVASTLTNVGALLGEQRAFAAAREAHEEALDIRRKLAEAEPQIFLPDVANTVNNLGIVLQDQRAFPAARKAHEEALATYRQLARAEPRIYLVRVARVLNELGGALQQQQAFSAARASYEEALAIQRGLANAEPHIYLPDMAITLNNLGTVLQDQRAFAEALGAHEEALGIRRDLARAEPRIYLRYVADSLNNLGIVLRQQQALAEARKTHEEALDIYRDLAREEPIVYLPDVTAMLNNLGLLLREMGLEEEALAAALGAVHAAEDPAVPAGQRYLLKGNASGSYLILLMAEVERTQAEPDVIYRYLAAMRSGDACATRGGSDEGLAAAAQVLERANWALGLASILIVQELVGSTLLVHLSGRACDLRWWRVDGLRQAASELMEAYSGWYGGLDALDAGQASVEGMAALVEQVKSRAAAVWQALPPAVQDILRPRPDGGQVQILLSPDMPWGNFPFEVLRFGENEGDYLGLHRALPRLAGIAAFELAHLATDETDKRTSALVIADPTQDLLYAPREGGAVARILEGHGMQVTGLGSSFASPATTESVQAALASSPSIIHYTGHGTLLDVRSRAADGGPHMALGEEALCLADGLLGPWDLRDWDRRLDGSVVILNSCMTGRARGFGGMREDLASSFLRLGADAVVASAFPVSDLLGLQFGIALHRGGREPLQDRFLRARNKAARAATGKRWLLWPGWALLTLHGNPFVTMPPRNISEESLRTSLGDLLGVGPDRITEDELRDVLG